MKAIFSAQKTEQSAHQLFIDAQVALLQIGYEIHHVEHHPMSCYTTTFHLMGTPRYQSPQEVTVANHESLLEIVCEGSDREHVIRVANNIGSALKQLGFTLDPPTLRDR